MRDLKNMQIIDIDITNYCDKRCSNCTRMIGHYKTNQLYFMDLDYFEKAVISLKDFEGIIGIIGGEPTLHPQFPEICKILAKHIPDKKRRGIFSNRGEYYKKYEELIDDTFDFYVVNHDKSRVFHAPILVSIKSMISDPVKREELIDNCWIQTTWSGTINPKGGFFCEVAGAMSILLDGPMGFDIVKEPGWWKRPIADFNEQRKWACNRCGAAVKTKPRKASEEIDDISPDNLELLKDRSAKLKQGRYEIYDKGIIEDQKRHVYWYTVYNENVRFDNNNNNQNYKMVPHHRKNKPYKKNIYRGG